MNDSNPGVIAGPVPPFIPPSMPHAPQPLGSDPIERMPISGVVGAVEALLRQPRRIMYQLKQPNAGKLIASLLLVSILCSIIYGVVVGTFSNGAQLWAAPVKISGGLLISASICLPSLYIFACLSGSHARLAEVFGLVAGLLALMTMLLVGFAPVAWVFSQSTKSLQMMGGLHLAFWVIATIFGLRLLLAGFRYTNARSEAGFRIWVVIFMMVAFQMTTALRPILGSSKTFFPPATEKKFFLEYWYDSVNAWDTNLPASGVEHPKPEESRSK